MTIVANKAGVTSFATPTDNQVSITRVFDAPRHLLYQAYTTPRLLQQWLLGPEGWTMPVCEIDVRVGGAWRYVWRKSDGTEMAMGGTVKEVVPNERLVSTERWGPEWPETINQVEFTESGGRTTVTTTITYPSKDARDAALKTGMKDGADQSYARLEQLVRTLA
jgi:uncharacterized protein YndB with AHSA1/START domain